MDDIVIINTNKNNEKKVQIRYTREEMIKISINMYKK